MTIVYFIILLSVIVLVHELGHLLTAKFFKVYCYEFAIGMGPKLFAYKGKETTYSLRVLPIGGFVAMAGEDEDNRGIEVAYERTIKGIKKWQQIIIMLAGVFMNFLLAWVVISGILLYNGSYLEPAKPIVAGVMENSPADLAGLQKGDYIVKVTLSDGTEIVPKDFYDILPFSKTDAGLIIYSVVRSDGQKLDIEVTPLLDAEDNTYYSGILIPNGELVEVNILNVPYYGAKYIGNITKTMFVTLIRLFKGVGLENLSGPVGVYNITAQQVSLGFSNFMMLMAFLSLNIGIFNLLPLPILDGGRALITFGEMITGKTLNKKIETALMLAGWLFIIALMVFSTWQDINRLF